MTLYPRGAEWRKWDLHIHTPSSFEHHYNSAPSEDVWVRFIDELEALPRDIRVIGVNDYWVFDGYKRLLAEKAAGRLNNIDALFPVVEMRLEAFGGTTHKLSRANAHVVFDPSLDIELIETQFLAGLVRSFKLDPIRNDLDWNNLINRESIRELGAKVRAAMPAGEPSPSESDEKLGFNALVVPLEAVQAARSIGPIRNRSLLALGKTEWADIKWTDQAMASKRNLVNEADILFTAFESVDDWPTQRQKLKNANVRDALLDCSDAHNWTESAEKDRLGNCATWLRADPTLAGLKQSLLDFDSRVFVGLQPEDLRRANVEPENIVERLRVARTDGTHGKPFNYDVELNPRLVAVVGNKGQGKSAFLDCLARAGNSSRSDFAFLNEDRFLTSRNRRRAADISASITWLSGDARSTSLTDSYDSSSRERVEYLPQSFIERVCSSDPVGEQSDAFENELKAVLFTHITDADRGGLSSFDALLAQKTSASNKELESLREELRRSAAVWEALLQESSETSVYDLRGRLEELDALRTAAVADRDESAKELAKIDASRVASPELLQAETELSRLGIEATSLDEKRRNATTIEVAAANRVRDFEALAAQLSEGIESLQTTVIGIQTTLPDTFRPGERAATVAQNESYLAAARDFVTQAVDVAKSESAAASQAITANREKLDQERARLEQLDQVREFARRELGQLDERIAALAGRAEDPDSILGLEARIERLTALPALVQTAETALIDLSKKIHSLLLARLEVVKDLYAPASKFIADSDIASQAEIEFSASLLVGKGWTESIEQIDGRKRRVLADWMTSVPRDVDGSDEDQVSAALAHLLDGLKDVDSGTSKHPADGLRSRASVSDFVEDTFGLKWIELRFGLSGRGLSLQELSPGQRGLILLLFYLVVDKRNVPLLLDQPEENLDNETIKDLLVPALRDSSARRQVVIVTHNANLAIVGSADQIVHCSQVDHEFLLETGSAADKATGLSAVDVLEGTWDAFEQRRSIYQSASV